MSTPAGAATSSSSSSSLAGARRARTAAPWKTVPHFGQTIGSLLRSKNLAPQCLALALGSEFGFGHGDRSLSLSGGIRSASVSRRRRPVNAISPARRQRPGGGVTSALAPRHEASTSKPASRACPVLPASRARRSALARRGPLQRPRAAARRQVDLPPRLPVRPAQPAARPRSRACWRATTCCARARPAGARRRSRAPWRRAAGRVRGPGLGALLAPRATLDFGNAGTGSRLMMGVVGGHGITATFDGDASLRKRPMRRILDPAAADGRGGPVEAEGGRCPITLQGRARPRADRLSHAGRLGADQVGGAARGPQRARRARR